MFKKLLPNPRLCTFSLMFSLKILIVLALKFRSLIHFELCFGIWCDAGFFLHCSACGYPVDPTPFAENSIFFFYPVMILTPLLKINWP